MRLYVYLILFLLVSGCCLTGTKCNDDDLRLNFKILDFTSGKDLVFGSSNMYYADSIRFFSLIGGDTVNHYCRPELQSYNSADSVLALDLNGTNVSTIFMRLTHSDIDTLQLTYSVHDGGQCCGDYQTINSITYNSSMNAMDGRLFKK